MGKVISEISKIGWRFDNSYTRLPDIMLSRLAPVPVRIPKLIILNHTLSEELGLDETWLGEHHFSRHGLLSGFFSFLGHVAAKTSKIKLGTAILQIGTRTATNTAMGALSMNSLSNGRFILGLGTVSNVDVFRDLYYKSVSRSTGYCYIVEDEMAKKYYRELLNAKI